jgi:hypothetical protein
MKIFGQVLDTKDEPMGWANITVVLSANSNQQAYDTQADLDGNFVLDYDVIKPDTEFKISYVGYVPQFFKASELQGKKIKLVEDIEMLQEVTVTGGGKPKDNKPNQTTTTKLKFTEHLQKHRFAYAGIGGLAGVLLIVKALKN